MSKNKTTEKEKKTKQRVVLLDAHAIIHRAYHALPDFTSSRGEPTGALYGVSAMLIRIIQELKPDHIIACYDLPDPTHRHEVFNEYKGTRAGIEEALIKQLIRSRDVFKAFGIPVYEAPGFEADDIIGTFVKQLKDDEGKETIIASGDLDTLQLVSEKKVRVYTLRKGLSDTVTYDEDTVRERYGFGPEHVVDYKGLRGDPSDNIPGVRGIGEKTATELVIAFGTIENIYKILKKEPELFEEKGFKPRIVKLLTEGEDDAVFSKMIATIREDAPVSIDLAKEWKETADIQKVLDLFDELDFRALSERARTLFKNMFGETGLGEEIGKEEEVKEEVDPQSAREAQVALWLLASDITTPSTDDVLRFAKKNTFKEARDHIYKELKETGRLWEVFENIERPLIPIMERMQEDGITLDKTYLKKLSIEYHTELRAISERIFAHAGHEFNINSPKQLGAVLFDELGLLNAKHKRTETGQRSTRESELEKIKDVHPIVRDVLAYRELQKLLSTYIDNLPKLVGDDGRIHAQFLQDGTTTGRLSSQNPNLQNIPIRSEYGRRIRNAFTASKGFVIVALDYSQIELRIAAALSGDEKLIEVFRKGEDIHTAVASEVFNVSLTEVDAEMRRRAKIINFGILYGMGVNALRVNLGEGVSRDDAAKFLNEYFKRFSGLASYIERIKADASKNGFTETLFGRRRYFSGFESPLPYVRAQAERMAINAPIQGTQADIIKKAMITTDGYIEKNTLRDTVRLALQIHDELVFEIEEGRAEELGEGFRHIMESVVSPKDLNGVPILADLSVGPNWGELKKVKTENEK